MYKDSPTPSWKPLSGVFVFVFDSIKGSDTFKAVISTSHYLCVRLFPRLSLEKHIFWWIRVRDFIDFIQKFHLFVFILRSWMVGIPKVNKMLEILIIENERITLLQSMAKQSLPLPYPLQTSLMQHQNADIQAKKVALMCCVYMCWALEILIFLCDGPGKLCLDHRKLCLDQYICFLRSAPKSRDDHDSHVSSDSQQCMGVRASVWKTLTFTQLILIKVLGLFGPTPMCAPEAGTGRSPRFITLDPDVCGLSHQCSISAHDGLM